MANTRTASLSPEIDNWFREKDINFSEFVRDKIEEEMSKEVKKKEIERNDKTRIAFLEMKVKKLLEYIKEKGLFEDMISRNGNAQPENATVLD